MTKNSIYKSETGKKQVLAFYKELLQNWCRPFKQHCIQTSFGETFIIENGNESLPPLVLLHGTGSNSAMWMADVNRLSEKFHVFSIDILGECGLSGENRLEYKDTDYSDWLLEILKKLQIDTLSIVGCSLGGWIALDFSIRCPERVEKLVLLATAGVAQVKTSAIFWIIMTTLTGRWGFRKLNKMVYRNLAIDKKALDFTSLVKSYYKPRADVLPVFSDGQLKKIMASTLFIGGENDCFYDSQKTALRLQGVLDSFRYLLLENTGHVLVNQTESMLRFLTDGK